MNARLDDPADCELGDVDREASDFEHRLAIHDDADSWSIWAVELDLMDEEAA